MSDSWVFSFGRGSFSWTGRAVRPVRGRAQELQETAPPGRRCPGGRLAVREPEESPREHHPHHHHRELFGRNVTAHLAAGGRFFQGLDEKLPRNVYFVKEL